jgi:hypothetical protein
MNITLGIIFLVVSVVMLWFGRARQGEPRSFMRVWIVGMAYPMTCMIFLVMGFALLILA